MARYNKVHAAQEETRNSFMQPPTEVILRRQSFRRESDEDRLGNGKEDHRPFPDSVQHSDNEPAAPSSSASPAAADAGKGREVGQPPGNGQHAEQKADSPQADGKSESSILVASQPNENGVQDSHADLEANAMR